MKRFVAGLAFMAICISTAACSSNTSSPGTTTQPAEATTVAISEETNTSQITGNDFTPITVEEANSIPEQKQMGTAMGLAAGSVGATKADINDNTKWEFGNYRNDSTDGIENYSLTCRATTPTGKRLDFLMSYVKAQNPYGSTKDNHWTVASIKNVDNGHCYYVMDGATGQYDIYDFQTDQFKGTYSGSSNSITGTTEAQESTTEKKENTKTYKAVEEAKEFSPNVTFTENMSSDVTGRWRLAEIDKNIDIQDYAVSYYKTYFKDPSEVHIIINYSRNVTTCMTSYGNLLYVDLYDLVSPADKDAKLSLSGTPLANYKVDLNTGKIEKIE